MPGFWTRIRGWFSRLFRRKPPQPGRFEADSKASFRGFLATAPWIWPKRDYLVYVPRGHSNWRRAPLLVLLHGCRQTPEEIAAATRITTLADAIGCLVLLPRQNPRANAWGCWNWFDPATARGWGETAIVAAQIRAVRRKYWIGRKRVIVAGLSSGGGLAAALGLCRPALIAAVFVHSGIPCAAASSPLHALTVLKSGADTDFVQVAAAARAEARESALPVPLMVVHGGRDDVVTPILSAQLVRQYLALDDHPAAGEGALVELPPADYVEETTTPDAARVVTTREWRAGERLVARHVLVDALGHAWSGGDAAYPFNDPLSPDATALLWAFMRDAVR
jgi:poly(hydroxyalkanoate) depolymerase family esterase